MNNSLKLSKYITISLPTSTWSPCFVDIEANSGSVYCLDYRPGQVCQVEPKGLGSNGGPQYAKSWLYKAGIGYLVDKADKFCHLSPDISL